MEIEFIIDFEKLIGYILGKYEADPHEFALNSKIDQIGVMDLKLRRFKDQLRLIEIGVEISRKKITKARYLYMHNCIKNVEKRIEQEHAAQLKEVARLEKMLKNEFVNDPNVSLIESYAW